MNNLKDKKCVPCEGGILPFDISEIHKYQKKVDGWDVKKNIKKKYFLEKNYKKRVVICTYFARLFMILIKKYKVRLFIILTHFKDGNWY